MDGALNAQQQGGLSDEEADIILPLAKWLYARDPAHREFDELVSWGWLGLQRARQAWDGSGEWLGYARMKVKFAMLDGERREYGSPSGQWEQRRRWARKQRERWGRVQLLEHELQPHPFSREEARAECEYLISTLPPRMQRVMAGRYLLGLSNAEAAAYAGVLMWQSSRLHTRALAQLRRSA